MATHISFENNYASCVGGAIYSDIRMSWHVTSVSLIWSHLSALYGGNEHATSSSHPQHCRISGLQLVDCFSGAMHFVAGQLL